MGSAQLVSRPVRYHTRRKYWLPFVEAPLVTDEHVIHVATLDYAWPYH